MKFTVSTLLALFIAVPVTVVQAFDLQVDIVSTLQSGTITVFPDGSPVKLHEVKGELPIIGSLHLTGIGPDHFGRFDTVETSLAPHDYLQCRVWAAEDPKVPKLDFKVDGPLAFLTVSAPGYDSKIESKCKWIKNGENWTATE